MNIFSLIDSLGAQALGTMLTVAVIATIVVTIGVFVQTKAIARTVMVLVCGALICAAIGGGLAYISGVFGNTLA